MKDLIFARDGLYGLFYFQQKDIRPVGIHRDIQNLPNNLLSCEVQTCI